MFISSPFLDGWSWKTWVLMSFSSLNSQSLRALVFDSFPLLIFPGSGAVNCFSCLMCLVAFLMRHFGKIGVYSCCLHFS